MKQIIFFFLFFLHILMLGYSQDFFKIPNTQIRFWAKPVLMNNLKFDHYRTQILKSKPTISFEAGIGVKQRIWDNLSIIVDAGYNIIPYQFQFVFNANIEHIEGDLHEHKTTEFYQGLYVIPVSLQFETLKNKKLNYFAELGAKINIINWFPFRGRDGMSYYLGDLIPPDNNGNQDLNVFEMIMENETQRVFISYFAKIGLLFKTKKTHTFNLSLVANYCPKPVYTGDYKFENVPFESYGDVSLGLNYIGLEFVYGLSVWKVDFLPRK